MSVFILKDMWTYERAVKRPKWLAASQSRRRRMFACLQILMHSGVRIYHHLLFLNFFDFTSRRASIIYGKIEFSLSEKVKKILEFKSFNVSQLIIPMVHCNFFHI